MFDVLRFLFNSTQDDGIDDDEGDDDEMDDDDDDEMYDDNDDDGLESYFEVLRSWVEKTDQFSDWLRPRFKSILEALILSIQSTLHARQLDLRQVRKELNELIQSSSKETISGVGKPVLQSCLDVSFTFIECLFNKPLNLTPVRDALHDAIDRHCDPPNPDHEDYKYLASATCEILQYLITARLTLFSMYSLQAKLQENNQLRELKLLMYKLRKRGICVYMRYIHAR